MLGKHRIRIKTNKISYDIEVKQKITVIDDDSGTGKTTFVNIVKSYLEDRTSVDLTCDVGLVVLDSNETVKELLESFVNSGLKNKIIIIDDNVDLHNYLYSLINKIDCFFIIMSRKYDFGLSYDVFEIYNLKYDEDTNTNRLINKYKDNVLHIKPDLIITEDARAGFTFFKNICDKIGITCVSSAGKNNMINALSEYSKNDEYNCIYGIVDGAAFGSFVKKFIEKEWGSKKIYLGVPKSFEYLLLHITDINADYNIFDKYYDYCDVDRYRELFKKTNAVYKDFISLERFYTQYLSDITSKTDFEYYKSKNKLKDIYFDSKYQNEVLSELKDLDITV